MGGQEQERLTHGPSSVQDTVKDSVHLTLVVHPLATDQRHAHSPQTPAEERHPLQFLLREPSTSPQHAAPNRRLLDEVEIRPFDMVGDDDSRLSLRQVLSAGHDDLGAVDAGEDELDAAPYGLGDAGGEIVRQVGGEEGDGQQGGQQEVGEEEMQQPGRGEEGAAHAKQQSPEASEKGSHTLSSTNSWRGARVEQAWIDCCGIMRLGV